MLPIRKILAILVEDHHFCVWLCLELSLVRRLNRASGKMRYLFPVIPHYWILKTKYYTAYRGLGWEQLHNRRAIRSSPFVSGNENITCVIYINISLQSCQTSNSSFITIFITTTQSVVNVTVPAVISRNIGTMCCILIILPR